MVNNQNHNNFLKIKEILQGYSWTMNCLIKGNRDIAGLAEQLFSSLRKADLFLENVYVQYRRQPDGTLTFDIKKKVLK